MSINCAFDAGAIDVVSLANPKDIQLNIRHDNASEFAQWFYFQLSGGKGQAIKMRFLNASTSAYPQGWDDYNVVASYNRVDWFRVATHYDKKEMVVHFLPEADTVWFAYFEPYSSERHLDLIGFANEYEHVDVIQLGQTIDGRDMTVLEVTNAESDIPFAEKKKVWLTARQHPGETMAEWFVEGFLERLLNLDEPVSRQLLDQAVFYIVPNMNPDGSARGNLRTNAVGANLNREWQTPTMERSPEVFLVRQKMLETGVDLFLDAHGDEGLPYNFVAGCEGIPAYDERHKKLEDAFKAAWAAVSPDFQDKFGYEKDAPGQANMTLATTWIGQQFKCLSYTIEMPFKDNANLPDGDVGWSGERSRVFGASVLNPILMILPQLR
ncbi:carboxypeptidase family protein [Permianibacter sp. IMCC34836]|nr:carboxypeptidase family protein [Permianibacter fluminis]